MWLDIKRVEFLENESRRKFFDELKQKSKLLTDEEIAMKSKIPIGRLKLYKNGSRSIPKCLFDLWVQKYSIDDSNYNYKTFEARQLLSEKGKKGQKKLVQKYGRRWLVNIGKQRMQNMRKDFKNNPDLYKKWRQSIKESLIKKYGKNCYRQMGLLGGKRAIEKADKEELRLRLKIFGYYPDFFLNNKTIIEVVGFAWKPHLERTKKKIELFTKKGFVVIVYTYPNMIKYFENTHAKIITKQRDMLNILAYNRG